MTIEQRIREIFTGLVLDGLAVEPDPQEWSLSCASCDDRTLAAGDRVLVAATNYENHSWEIVAVACASHDWDGLSEVLPMRAEQQVLLEATLERAGYHSPDGVYYPDALTLGAVELLEYSPTADGY